MNDRAKHFLLHLMKPFISGMNLRIARDVQDRCGAAMIKYFDVNPEFTHPDNDDGVIISRGVNNTNSTLLYLHGGAYETGDEGYIRGVAGIMSCKTGMDVIGVRYRLSPEHPFPAGLDDAYKAYETFSGKYDNIYLFGDSAGGGMAFSLCSLILRDGLKEPRGIISFSPWTDLTFSGASYKANKRVDPTLSERELRKSAQKYIAGDSAENPLISPVFLDTTGFPKTLLFAGGDELLKSDAEMMHENLTMHGARSELVIHAGMWHVYPLYMTEFDAEIFDKIREFIR